MVDTIALSIRRIHADQRCCAPIDSIGYAARIASRRCCAICGVIRSDGINFCCLISQLDSLCCNEVPRTDSPPVSNMHGLKSVSCRLCSGLIRIWALTCCADSGSACKLAGVQIIPLPTLANQILARTFFRSLVLLCAYPAVEKFCRASSAGGRRHLQIKFVQPDRVGRRGLSEPGGIFSRLITYVWTQKWFVQILAAE